MYQTIVRSGREAFLHLLLYCCHKDGECNEQEMRTIAGIAQQLYGIEEEERQKEEARFQEYIVSLKDEIHYLRFLLHHIKPTNRLALLWYCTQVTASDKNIAFSEELLISKLASMLHVQADECQLLHRLSLQVHTAEQEQMV